MVTPGEPPQVGCWDQNLLPDSFGGEFASRYQVVE